MENVVLERGRRPCFSKASERSSLSEKAGRLLDICKKAGTSPYNKHASAYGMRDASARRYQKPAGRFLYGVQTEICRILHDAPSRQVQLNIRISIK